MWPFTGSKIMLECHFGGEKREADSDFLSSACRGDWVQRESFTFFFFCFLRRISGAPRRERCQTLPEEDEGEDDRASEGSIMMRDEDAFVF